jgi:hypothetical protein
LCGVTVLGVVLDEELPDWTWLGLGLALWMGLTRALRAPGAVSGFLPNGQRDGLGRPALAATTVPAWVEIDFIALPQNR